MFRILPEDVDNAHRQPDKHAYIHKRNEEQNKSEQHTTLITPRHVPSHVEYRR